MKRLTVLLAAALGAVFFVSNSAFCQSSANFKLQESVLNAGGNPSGGSVLSSASFRIRLDAIGDGLAQQGMSSSSWEMDTGFLAAYPPPGEVQGLRFGPGRTTLLWTPERSVGAYNLYKGSVPAFLPEYGVCSQSGLIAETATDTTAPLAGGAQYYLVTARNRLAEEGTKGFASSGVERSAGSPCP
jgi:hypothetical protein